jgi:hypothetical protein
MNDTAVYLDAPYHLLAPCIILGDGENLPPVVLESGRTTEAALAFFEATDGAAILDAFNHLVAIVLKAKGNLYLTEIGTTTFEATRRFVEGWLLEKLLRYRKAGAFRKAAERGKFRYLGRQGQYALIDELRRRTRSKDPFDKTMVPLDAPIGTEYGDDFCNRGDLIGVDCQEAVSPIGTKPSLEPATLQQALLRCRAEMATKLGDRLFDILYIVCGLFPDRLKFGDVTRGIARAQGVSDQTARRLHHELASALVPLREDPVFRGFFEIIYSAGDPALLDPGFWD